MYVETDMAILDICRICNISQEKLHDLRRERGIPNRRSLIDEDRRYFPDKYKKRQR